MLKNIINEIKEKREERRQEYLRNFQAYVDLVNGVDIFEHEYIKNNQEMEF